MTRQSVESWLAAHLWKVIVTAFAIGGGYTVLTAAVDSKLPRAEFESYRSERATVDSTMLRELRTIKVLECRDKPLDSYCVQP